HVARPNRLLPSGMNECLRRQPGKVIAGGQRKLLRSSRPASRKNRCERLSLDSQVAMKVRGLTTPPKTLPSCRNYSKRSNRRNSTLLKVAPNLASELFDALQFLAKVCRDHALAHLHNIAIHRLKQLVHLDRLLSNLLEVVGLVADLHAGLFRGDDAFPPQPFIHLLYPGLFHLAIGTYTLTIKAPGDEYDEE